MSRAAAGAAILAALAAVGIGMGSTSTSPAPRSCAVTLPNATRTPYDPARGSYIGNGWIWVSVYPFDVVTAKRSDVRADGAIAIKYPWYRRAAGRQLHISGRRLDASARPLRAEIPRGYGANFQASEIIFPLEGCWRVTGRVGDRRLTFITLVIKR
jgi:hypothetical protein